MISNKRSKVLAICTIMLAAAALAMGQGKTRLQVFVTSERQKADTLAQQLDTMGYGPAQVRPEGNLFKVLTRAYASPAEAALVKPYLKGAGFFDSWAVTDEATPAPPDAKTLFGETPSVAPALAAGSVTIDFAKPAHKATAKPSISAELRALDNASADEKQLMAKLSAYGDVTEADEALAAIDTFVTRFPASKKLAAAKLQRAHWLLKKQDVQGAIEQFDRVAREHAGQVEAGEAELRGAYLGIRTKELPVEVLRRFERIARAEVACTPQVRLEAMMRCAALYHRAKDLSRAQAAFEAVCQASSDAEVQAYAKMQIAALTLEQAWNGKATLAQARQLADAVVASFPQVNVSTRATAALVALETLAYERKYTQVLEREARFVQEYAQTPELQLGYYWFALAHVETGDSASAKAILHALLEANFPTQERFRTVNVTASAQRLLTRIEEAQKSQ